MPRQLSPIRVLVKLAPDGKIIYPDFDQLQVVKDSGVRWPYFIDHYGGGLYGWLKDPKDDLHADAVDSPFGQQTMVRLVSTEFAEQADAMFPEQVEVMTDAEFEAFWDDVAMAGQPEVVYDLPVLQALAAKKQAGAELTAEEQAAFDPASEVRGIRPNKLRRWQDAKSRGGQVQIVGRAEATPRKVLR